MDNGADSYRRFLEGNDEGLAEIIRQYSDGLILYIDSFIRNIGVSEDIMEDVFVEIAIKKPKYSERSSFKTWLYSIAHHVAVDHIRKNSHYHNVPMDERQKLSDETDLEKSHIIKEQKIELYKAMSIMNPDYRQILYLIYFEDFSYDEAAKIMKKSGKQIKNLVYRAKEALRKELERRGFVYEEL